MAEPLVPPDQIGSGLVRQPQPVPPMRQTTLPDPIARQMRDTGMSGLGLLSMLNAPQPAPNLGLAAASGALQYAPGGRGGPNAYLAGHQQQMESDQVHRMQQVQLADRMMQRRREQEEKQDAALMVVIDSLKDSDNPGAQAVYANEMARRGERLGLKIAPEFYAQSVKLGKEEIEQINDDLVAGLPPGQIHARHPKLARMDPNWLKSQAQLLKNPAMRDKMGYKSDDALRAERVERDRKVAEAETATWRAKHKDIDDKSLPYVAQYVQQYGGMPLIGLDPSNPVHQELKTKALAWAREQIKANDTAWQSLRETKRAHRVGESQKERELRLKEAEGPGGGKQLSSEATGQVVGMVRLGEATGTIDRIGNDPKKRKIVDNYIGPYASPYVAVQTYAPGGILGKVPQEVVDLRQATASLKNYTIKLITGAQMSEKEATRIANELFDMNLPPDQFWRRYENSKNVVNKMKQVVEAGLIRGDRRALESLLRAEGLAPGAGPLSPASTGTRRIRVRDNKTNKIHDAELGPGDMVPPGYTEIK
jgi:hypothetical protein